MCGRYALALTTDAIAAAFAATPLFPDVAAWRARFNIAPTSQVPAVLPAGATRELALVHWGLIPFWAKDPSIGSRLANARSETLAEKPSFRDAWKKRRCLLPATAFYEWKTAATTSDGNAENIDNAETGGNVERADGAEPDEASLFGAALEETAPKRAPKRVKAVAPPKQPFAIAPRPGELFAFGAVWERWTAPDGRVVRSAAIITVPPNDVMRPIHDRMPAIIPSAAWSRWLLADEPPADLLVPAANSTLQAWPVSRLVNSPRNDSAECLRPLDAS
ncbi:MAG: SOS response-associated peptidase [Phycisphaerae bacterium]|nr:SOS response-associated peptidase [Phycisphaerae bacterium]